MLVVSVCLAFSAFYELIEWWSAVFLGDGSDAFLGSQGDIWDAQWDMFLALIGAIVSQLHPVSPPRSGTARPHNKANLIGLAAKQARRRRARTRRRGLSRP